MVSGSLSTGSFLHSCVAVLTKIASFLHAGIGIMTGTMIGTTMTGIMIENVEEHGTGTGTGTETEKGTGIGTETVTA